MNRETYFLEIEQGLYGLPREDIARWLDYYRESLEDRIEDGLDEQQAMAQMGTPTEVVQQILAQTPLVRVLRSRVTPQKRMPAWAIVALIVGSPLWLALVISALAVVISVYAVLWSLLIAFYAVDVAFAGAGVGCLGGAFALFLGGHFVPGLLCVAAGLLCAGLAILCFLPLGRMTRGTVRSCGYFMVFVKTIFVGKGEK